jgi:hypothetical protein
MEESQTEEENQTRGKVRPGREGRLGRKSEIKK